MKTAALLGLVCGALSGAAGVHAALAAEAAPGVTLEASATADTWSLLHGGLGPAGASDVRECLDFAVTLDLEALGLWRGALASATFQEAHGRGPTDRHVGDLQYLSNIDARDLDQVGEYWLEQRLGGERLRVKLGKQDCGEEFCVLESARPFINSSFYVMPNIPMPIWPETGLGAVAFARALPWLSVGAGVYDGDPDGASSGFGTAFDGEGGGFQIVEGTLAPSRAPLGLPGGSYKVGLWRHTADVDEITADDPYWIYSQNHGLYVTVDQPLWLEAATAAAEEDAAPQGLSAFFQFGWAPGDRNEIRDYFGGGLVYTGLFAGRDADVIGAGFASAQLCRQLEWMEGLTGETAWELFYQAAVTPWLSVQPDVQYIVRPGGGGANALAAGMRLGVAF